MKRRYGIARWSVLLRFLVHGAGWVDRPPALYSGSSQHQVPEAIGRLRCRVTLGGPSHSCCCGYRARHDCFCKYSASPSLSLLLSSSSFATCCGMHALFLFLFLEIILPTRSYFPNSESLSRSVSVPQTPHRSAKLRQPRLLFLSSFLFQWLRLGRYCMLLFTPTSPCSLTVIPPKADEVAV